jgi:hypothetical protein
VLARDWVRSIKHEGRESSISYRDLVVPPIKPMREQQAEVEHAAIHRPQLQCQRTDDFTAGSRMTSTKQWGEAAQDALDRMHRAHDAAPAAI